MLTRGASSLGRGLACATFAALIALLPWRPGEPRDVAAGDAGTAAPIAAGAESGSVSEWGSVTIVEQSIAPGDKRQFFLHAETDFIGLALGTPVLVARGARPGPTLCVTGGIHGDELNGVEIARRVYAHAEPDDMAGMLVALPMVNMYGLRSRSRYMSDRRDLNRFFPGSEDGSATSLLARSVFQDVILGCSVLIDLHTGSFSRRNLPQIRGDLDDATVLRLAQTFGPAVIVAGVGPTGSLRRAAHDAGIPAIIYEAGAPLEFDEPEIVRGVQGVHNVMASLGIAGERPDRSAPPPIYRRSTWLRSPSGGIFLSEFTPGAKIRAGMLIGTVTDPITEVRSEVRAPLAGDLIGMAIPQFVLPGSALFHVGLDAAR